MKKIKKIVKKPIVKKPTAKPVKVVSEPKLKPELKSLFSISLNIGGEVCKTQGNTILECLEKLNPSTWKSKGIITLTNGGKKAERYLQVKQMRSLFKGNKLHKLVLVKLLGLLLR